MLKVKLDVEVVVLVVLSRLVPLRTIPTVESEAPLVATAQKKVMFWPVTGKPSAELIVTLVQSNTIIESVALILNLTFPLLYVYAHVSVGGAGYPELDFVELESVHATEPDCGHTRTAAPAVRFPPETATCVSTSVGIGCPMVPHGR